MIPRAQTLLRACASGVAFGLGIPTLGAVAVLGAASTVAAQAQTPAKIVQGKVFNAQETPLSGAIVYLQDQKSSVIKTFITTTDGSYRFGQLSADTDFKIWARYKDEKSKTRIISSFDPKLTVTMDFHVGK